MSSSSSHCWIEVSVPLRAGMVRWPGDPPVRVDPFRSMAKGDSCDVSLVSLGSHAGTHMDAPRHFLPGAPGIDRVDFDAVIGPARVIPIRDRESIKVKEMRLHRIRRGERILFKTRNSARCWKAGRFVPDFVHLSTEAAEFLADRRIRAIGVDYLSVGGYKRNGPAVHRALLKAGVWIIEGLDLSRARPGRCRLICLPLRIAGGDGAPARAILRQLP